MHGLLNRVSSVSKKQLGKLVKLLSLGRFQGFLKSFLLFLPMELAFGIGIPKTIKHRLICDHLYSIIHTLTLQ